jgi:hypothetical protein
MDTTTNKHKKLITMFIETLEKVNTILETTGEDDEIRPLVIHMGKILKKMEGQEGCQEGLIYFHIMFMNMLTMLDNLEK